MRLLPVTVSHVAIHATAVTAQNGRAPIIDGSMNWFMYAKANSGNDELVVFDVISPNNVPFIHIALTVPACVYEWIQCVAADALTNFLLLYLAAFRFLRLAFLFLLLMALFGDVYKLESRAVINWISWEIHSRW